LVTDRVEYTRECLAIDVAKSFRGQDIVELLRYLFAVRGCPRYIRSDNGPEFVSKAVKKWLKASFVETLYIAPSSPWENGYITITFYAFFSFVFYGVGCKYSFDISSFKIMR
jgi:transposase InsO family protein